MEFHPEHQTKQIVVITRSLDLTFWSRPPKGLFGIPNSLPKPFHCRFSSENFHFFKSKHSEREAFMESYGLIIRHLRRLEGLSLQMAATKIGKSIGWLSEVETASGVCRLTETEFNRIAEVLNGNGHRWTYPDSVDTKWWYNQNRVTERRENWKIQTIPKNLRSRPWNWQQTLGLWWKRAGNSESVM